MQYKSYSFENCDDTTLIELINRDNDASDSAFEVICARYLSLVRTIAHKYRNSADGYELSDFVQEGLIGLLSACKTYDKNGSAAFKNYAMLCVENRFRSIYRQQNKKSHSVVLSLDDSLNSIEDATAISMQETLESKEYIKSVYEKIQTTLSQLEQKVLRLYLCGYSYRQSAQTLNISEKAVDNALCRIRKKLTR